MKFIKINGLATVGHFIGMNDDRMLIKIYILQLQRNRKFSRTTHLQISGSLKLKLKKPVCLCVCECECVCECVCVCVCVCVCARALWTTEWIILLYKKKNKDNFMPNRLFKI